jgi:DNA-binding NarL/FixJ family response regulator
MAVPPVRRILVVDDHASMRTLLTMHLDRDGFEVVGEAVDAPSALAQARCLLPDGVVLDEELPHGPGTRILPELRGVLPLARIVVFSGDATCESRALELGADGFLLKGDPLDALQRLLGA